MAAQSPVLLRLTRKLRRNCIFRDRVHSLDTDIRWGIHFQQFGRRQEEIVTIAEYTKWAIAISSRTGS